MSGDPAPQSACVTMIQRRPSTAREVIQELAKLANPDRAVLLQSFFKTGKAQYAEGDRFLGIRVPDLRKVALRYAHSIPSEEVAALLQSPIHEHRLAALEILVAKYERGDSKEQKRIVRLYLQSTKRINNWDLVDASAPYILGDYLRERPRDIAGTKFFQRERLRDGRHNLSPR